jgi:hypothetical protein
MSEVPSQAHGRRSRAEESDVQQKVQSGYSRRQLIKVSAAAVSSAAIGIGTASAAESSSSGRFLASDAASRVTGSTYDATAGDSALYTA